MIFRRLAFYLTVFCICYSINTPAQTFQWAKALLSSSTIYVKGVAVDNSGNVLLCGEFIGTADFDPNAGTYNLTSNGGYDIFICKLNSAGNILWARSMGSADWDGCGSITTDPSGNVYATGSFSLTVDFDPGAGVLNLASSGGYDAFVLKLNSSGTFQWARKFGSTGTSEFGKSIKTDNSSNVYITGDFSNTIDFDPGSGVLNLTSAGGKDVFILKLNTSGNLVWCKRIGGTSSDEGNDITLDASNNVLVTGYFIGTVDFDPNSGTSNLISAGVQDAFVLKLNNTGNFIWARKFGSTGVDIGTAVDTDAAGYVYSAGYFAETVDFDPGSGTSNLVSAGFNDIYISKLNSSGNFIWARRIGGPLTDAPKDLLVDNYGYVYTTGEFMQTVDFNPNAGVANLTSAGANDTYFNKIHNSGTHSWAYKIGASAGDYGSGLAMDAGYNLYIGGIFTAAMDFNPFSGVFNINNGSGLDGFVLKIGQSVPLPVDFVSFDVKEKDNEAELEWHTASETNNDYFTVERSSDNNEWIELTKIPGAGNSTSVLRYRYIDEQPLNGISYYRIKQTDYNGEYSYSEVLAARFKNFKGPQLNIFPNPAVHELVIDVDGASTDEIKIMDLTGRDVKYLTPVIFTGEGRVILDISRLPENIYFITAGELTRKFVRVER